MNISFEAVKQRITSADAFENLDEWFDVFPVLVLAKSCAQSPRYHGEGDVWTHTRMCLQALQDSPQYQELPNTDQVVVYLSMLLHDVSKAATSSVNPHTGEIGHPGHSAKGAIAARQLLWELNCPFEMREQVCQIIAHHQVPFFAIQGQGPLKEAHYLARVLSQRMRLDLLCEVAKADMRGRICEDQGKVLEDIALFELLAQEEGCLDKPRSFASNATRVHYTNGTQCHPDYALFEEPGSTVWVMCGPPAAGKDTWVAQNQRKLPVVSFDQAKEELGLKHGDNDGKAAHFAVEKAKGYLREGQEFVFNATHLSKQMRSKTLDLVHRYQGRSKVVYLEASKSELLKRNGQRNNTLPNAKLLAMLHKWEVPTLDECFELYTPAKPWTC